MIETLAQTYRRTMAVLLIPVWLARRSALRKHFDDVPELRDYRTDAHKADLMRQLQEQRFAKLFERHAGGSFLEVGIGARANLARHRAREAMGIRYTGVDFAQTCVKHFTELEAHGLNPGYLEFAGNSRGTYSWNLMQMLREARTFDIIYIDGHHTFYVDLPAAMLSVLLLAPNGTIVFDDYLWTMALVARNMHADYRTWKFYRKIYDFSQYDHSQMRQPHIKMIVDDLLIAKSDFALDDAMSLPGWPVLRRNQRPAV